MSAIDERVVRMEFDNKEFEKNIKESIKSLDDLDKQLGLVGEEDAFDNIDKSSKKIDFKNMLNGLDKVSSGFSALETVAFGVLTRIGSKITDVVSQYAGQLTFKQIGAGFNKYEAQMNSMQTMMGATADTWQEDLYSSLQFLYEGRDITSDILQLTDELYNSGNYDGTYIDEWAEKYQITAEYLQDALDTVGQIQQITQEDYLSSLLNKLTWFTDETSYSYSNLSDVASKMTNFGYSASNAISAVQGIALWAAKAGKNASDAEHAANNMAQAFGKGYIAAEDWKSIDLVNMSTKEMKNLVIETAASLGTLQQETDDAGNAVYYYLNKTKKGIEKIEVTANNFKDTLKYKWFTNDVFMDTMYAYNAFADSTYSLINAFSDFNFTAYDVLDSITLFKDALADGEFSESAEKWRQSLESMFGDANSEEALAWAEAIAELSSEEYDFSRSAFEAGQSAKTLKDVMDGLKDAASTSWMNIFRNLFGQLETAREFWGEVYDYLDMIFVQPVKYLNQILEGWNNIELETGEVVAGSDLFRESILNILDAVTALLGPFEAVFGGESGIENAARSLFNFSVKFRDFTESLAPSDDMLEAIANVLSIIKGFLSGIFSLVSPIFKIVKPIVKLFGTLGTVLFRAVNAFTDIFSESTGSVVESVAETIGNAVDWIAEKLDIVSSWIDETFSYDAIREVFGTAADFIVNAWNSISDALQTAWSYISQILPSFDEISSAVSNFWSMISQYLPTWDEILQFLSATWELICQVGEAIWKSLEPYVGSLGDALSTFWSSLSSFFKGFIEAEDKIQYLKDTINGVINSFKEWRDNCKFLNDVRDRFTEIKDAVSKFFKQLPKGIGGKIAAIAFLAASLILLFKATQLADDAVWYFGKLTKAINRFSKVLSLIGLFLIVKAITDLVEALTALTKISDPTLLYVGFGAIITLLGAIIGAIALIKIITKTMSKEQLASFAVMVLALSIALNAIAKSLQIASKVNLEGLGYKVLAMIVLLGAIVGSVYLLTLFQRKIRWQSLLAIALIPVALLAAAVAFAIIGKLNPTEFEQAYKVITLFAGAILLAMVIGAILKNGAQSINNIASAVMKVAFAFLSIVVALKLLETVKITSGMIKTIWNIIGMLAIMGLLPVLYAGLANILLTGDEKLRSVKAVGKAIRSMCTGLILIAAAMVLLSYAMKKYEVTTEDLTAIGNIFTNIISEMGWLILFAGIAARLSSVNPNGLKQAGKVMTKIAISVVAMAAALAILTILYENSRTDKLMMAESMMKSIVSWITQLMLVAGFSARLATFSGQKYSAKPIVAVVFAIIAIVAAIAILAKMMGKEGARVQAAAGIMQSLIIAFGELMAFLGLANAIAQYGGGKFRSGPIISSIFVIMAITGALLLLATFCNEEELNAAANAMLKMCIALASIMVAFGLMTYLLKSNRSNSNSNNSLKIIRSIIVMVLAISAAIYIVAQALTLMQSVNLSWKPIFQVIVILGSLGLLFGAIAIVSGFIGGGPDNIYAISAMAVAIGASLLLIGMAFNKIKEANLDKATIWRVFGIFALLGALFGVIGLIAGATGVGAAGIVAVSAMILAIGVALILLAAAMAIASAAMPKLAVGIEMLGDAIKTFNFDGKQLDNFTRVLKNLAFLGIPAAIAFAVAALMLALAFSVLTVAAFVISAALPLIADGITVLGKAINDFAPSGEKLKQVTLTLLGFAFAGVIVGVAAILIAASLLIVAAAAFVVALALLIAASALAILSGILPELSSGMIIFVNTLVMLNAVASIALKTALKLGAAFFVLGVGGIFLGEALILVATAFLIVSVAALAIATAIRITVVSIAALASGIGLLVEGVAMLSDVFTGSDLSSKVDGFAAKLQEGGDKITSTLKTIREDASGSLGLEDLINLDSSEGSGLKDKLMGALGLNGEGGGMNWLSGLGLTGEGGLTDQLTSFFGGGGEGGGLQGMLSGLMTGENSVFSGIDFGGDFMDQLMGGADGLDVKALAEKYGGKLEGMDIGNYIADAGLGEQITTGIQTSIEDADMEGVGEETIEYVSTGMLSSAPKVSGASKQISGRGVAAIRSTKSSWTSAGTYIISGLIEGIQSKMNDAYSAIWIAARTMSDTANEALEINSPSRLFIETGKSIVEGLVVGITQDSDQAISSVRDMALETVGTASEILSAAIENDFTNPVIRPTLDLSNVAAGASSINSMFGQQTVGVDGTYATNGANTRGGVTYNYTQNNYSPKALDRIEIYRQTKNQINASHVLASV